MNIFQGANIYLSWDYKKIKRIFVKFFLKLKKIQE